MAALSRGLQIQDSHFHRQQQPLPLHGYEKPEL